MAQELSIIEFLKKHQEIELSQDFIQSLAKDYPVISLQKLQENAGFWSEFVAAVNKAVESKDLAELLQLKGHVLGKTGPIQLRMQNIRSMSVEEKKLIGPQTNAFKDFFQLYVEWKIEFFERAKMESELAASKRDITKRERLTAQYRRHGGLHPVTLVQREIEDIFLRMGFEVLDGPHIENEWNNFEALNIPSDHPARDMQDTFWFEHPHQPTPGDRPEGRYLLRTHTSTIQVRGMSERKPPFRFVAPGKVFRCERTDASHEMVFHQLEGMMVGKDISVANLIYFMKSLLSEIFLRDVQVRLRPGFFPFVEPGFELDIHCLICGGKGCSVCKQVGWVELLPCGMVHPNVLSSGGIDPKEWSGFAFGLGLDRLVMMRYGIDDIRHLHGGDLRFLEQFKQY